MNQAVVALWDTLRSIAFGATSAAYAKIGTPFTHECRILTLQNLTDAQMIFSTDGVNDGKTLPAGGQLIIDYMSDKSEVAGALYLPAGTQIWVKTPGAPSTGNVYVSVDYGKGE